MLIQFSVKNFRSFKEEATLSLVASSGRELKESNTFEPRPKLRLTKGAALYGANASGKSNLLKALLRMQRFVTHSVEQSIDPTFLDVRPFQLDQDSAGKPTHFEVVIVIATSIFRYGFEIFDDQISSEWLFQQTKQKEEQLFYRKLGEESFAVDKNRFAEGLDLESKTRANALFLTVIAQFNGAVASQVVEWFRNDIKGLNSPKDHHKFYTKKRILESAEFRKTVAQFLKHADIGIDDVTAKRSESPHLEFLNEMPDKVRDIFSEIEGIEIATTHRKYNANGEPVGWADFDLTTDESEGTQRFFSLLGPFLGVLQQGGVLVVDEIDASLHPQLVVRIVQLFQSSTTNPKNAQLIFTTHDTTLLAEAVLRRDQVWLVNKDRFGASSLFSLVEYQVRSDASFERDYRQGRYGGVPIIGSNLSEIVQRLTSQRSH